MPLWLRGVITLAVCAGLMWVAVVVLNFDLATAVMIVCVFPLLGVLIGRRFNSMLRKREFTALRSLQCGARLVVTAHKAAMRMLTLIVALPLD